MSLICIGVTHPNSPEQFVNLKKKLLRVAANNGRGISFQIDWHEPIVDALAHSDMMFSLSDSPKQEMCEMLLLPNGWYCNGETNSSSLQTRMCLLQELAAAILSDGLPVEYYIGLSGEPMEEYDTFTFTVSELPSKLENLIDSFTCEYAIHLIVHG